MRFCLWHDSGVQLMSAMIERLGDKDDNPLPQSKLEGCDSDEWSDDWTLANLLFSVCV